MERDFEYELECQQTEGTDARDSEDEVHQALKPNLSQSSSGSSSQPSSPIKLSQASSASSWNDESLSVTLGQCSIFVFTVRSNLKLIV